jgi:signal transduction histidine kinase
MKLLAKYNRINIGVTVIIMLVTGVIYYYAISRILTNQIDKDLVVEENEVFNYVRSNHKLPDVYESNHQQITFKSIGTREIERRFLDTVYQEIKQKEMEPGRALISSVNISGRNYRILVMQSKVETEDLIQIIFLITIALIAILLFVLLVLNRVILKSIWQPFYKVLNQLKAFSLEKEATINSIPTEIDEFAELDKAVIGMAERVKYDYQNLKAFTENASHELMTPIAVINSKLDTLVQTGAFTDQQSKLLNDIYGTVARLTRLNKSMLLLARIENGLIRDDREVDLKEIVEECLYQHEEMINRLNLDVSTEFQHTKVCASKLLIEVLLNNLISNAIRHNHANGTLSLKLESGQIIISNSGNGRFDFNQVLKRFYKTDHSEGIGLGLTLCKQICNNYGFKLAYTIEGNIHVFSVSFE